MSLESREEAQQSLLARFSRKLSLVMLSLHGEPRGRYGLSQPENVRDGFTKDPSLHNRVGAVLPGMFMQVILQPWQEFVGQRVEGCRVPETESILGGTTWT